MTIKYYPGALAASAILAACGAEVPSGGGFNLDCSIPSSQIYSGGVARDGIPALTNPETVPASDGINVINDQGRVLGVVVNGVARAYPMVVMWWHEVVNDTIGGVPVLVTYCPLTGSGIAFDSRVRGEKRTFGVSGLLFENNLIMFDHQTESLWNQMSVGAQCGPERGGNLARVPIVETSWGAWKNMHPNSRLVSLETGFSRSYGLYPYGSYADPDNPTRNFPGSRFSDVRPAKELVLGIFDGADAVAYPFGVFDDVGENFIAFNDVAIGNPVVITYDAGSQTAIPYRRDVNGQTLTFSVPDPTVAVLVDAETGTSWNMKGEALSGPLAGARLDSIADAYVAFWFAWSVYFPDLTLVESLN